MSLTGNPWDELCEVLDPKGCRVTNLPARIWLFGGPCAVNTEDGCLSLRQSFSKACLLWPSASTPLWMKALEQPEHYPDWWAFSGYSDLLEFERDAAYLSSAIVLFSESPGALAELGAFAIDETLLPRLIVVVDQKFVESANQRSFLNLGPLKRIRDNKMLCVIDSESSFSLSDDNVKITIDFITASLPTTHKTEAFLPNNPTHRLLLIADIIDLLIVSKADDLMCVLEHFKVSLPLEQLRKLLNLLQFFELVLIQNRGHEMFLTAPRRSAATWIDYTARHGRSAFERSKFKLSALDHVRGDTRRNLIYGRAE